MQKQEPELRIAGDQEMHPVTAEQLDLAMRMLGYSPSESATATERTQPSNGGYKANRAERRAMASKRRGASRNGQPIQRYNSKSQGYR